MAWCARINTDWRNGYIPKDSIASALASISVGGYGEAIVVDMIYNNRSSIHPYTPGCSLFFCATDLDCSPQQNRAHQWATMFNMCLNYDEQRLNYTNLTCNCYLKTIQFSIQTWWLGVKQDKSILTIFKYLFYYLWEQGLVGLFVCQQDYRKTTGPILVKEEPIKFRSGSK